MEQVHEETVGRGIGSRSTLEMIRRSLTSSFVSFLAAATFVLTLPLHAASPAWEKLTSLVGDWEGTVDGKPAKVSYRLVSNGTALLETLTTPDSSEMVSVYHIDKGSILMTHYCSEGNQPRMRAKGLANGKLAFTYVDAANLKSKDAMRMTGLVLGFPAEGQLVQEWTASGGGKDHSSRFEYKRVAAK